MSAKKERSKNKKESTQGDQAKEAKSHSTLSGIVEEKQYDFGGLPDLNLKKNLGCG